MDMFHLAIHKLQQLTIFISSEPIKTILLLCATVLAGGLGGFAQSWTTKSFERRKVEKEIKEAKKWLNDKSSMTDDLRDRIVDRTEQIDGLAIRELKIYVEKYRIRAVIWEQFGIPVDHSVYYYFAIHAAFVERKHESALYFIKEAISHGENNYGKKNKKLLDVYRWAARIYRLLGDEIKALDYLQTTENITSDNDTAFKCRLYRSMGFVYFNLQEFNQARRCFENSINLNDRVNQGKLAYAYAGLAMASYCRNETITKQDRGHLKKAIELEPLLGHANEKILLQNLDKLEQNYAYFITQFERNTLVKINAIYHRS